MLTLKKTTKVMASIALLISSALVLSIILLSLVLFVCNLFIPDTNNYTENKTKDNVFAVHPEEYVGYQYLQQQENAEDLIFVYDRIAYGIENLKQKILIATPFKSVNTEEMFEVVFCYIYDNPQAFWVDMKGISYHGIFDYAVFIGVDYKLDKAEIELSQKKITAIRDEIIKEVDGMSEKDKELYIHDYLTSNVTPCFGEESKNANTLYGAFIDGRANCLGFSHAFTYLMRETGTLCCSVCGYANNSSHAWNTVLIDGEYYNVDVTWNAHEPSKYRFYNLNEEELSKTHTKEEVAYAYPPYVK